MSGMSDTSTGTARSAMLATLRNVAGLSQQDAADLLDTSVQQLRRWESGAKTPPAGVLADMQDVVHDIDSFADLEAQDYLNDLPDGDVGPVVLLRYRDEDDRALTYDSDADHQTDQLGADRGFDLPIVSQAIATWRAAQHLEKAGHTVSIIWFDAREYTQWRDGRPDTMTTRRQWGRLAYARSSR